jgi:putative Holliday junction resolvase
MRSLGLDIGDRRIGVALSDPMGILASPLTIIHRRQDEAADIAVITSLICQHQVEEIIAGLPRSMNGSLGQQAEKVTSFSQRLSAQIEIPLIFRDERLSTVSAQRLMHTAGIKKASYDDAIAAAIILQGYLDEKYHHNKQ